MSGAAREEYRFHSADESRYSTKLACCRRVFVDLSCEEHSCFCGCVGCVCSCGKPGVSDNNYSVKKNLLKIMAKSLIVSVIIGLIVWFGLNYHVLVNADTTKYRLCVVDGRGGFKRASKYCPVLDKPDSKVECVIGLDRLDCLRRIAKGKVDFASFTAEDLVASANSQVDVLITNEMRYADTQIYEYDVVAIVNDDAGINSKYDLKGKKLCHPGYGYETDWTSILSNFLEATVVPKSCIEGISLTENRIKASSEYFKSACKAGPWVTDSILDEQLKDKYPNLCALCGNPGRCNMNDKYWGRRGPLYCLTDNVGDVSWARLDDARVHFGLAGGDGAAATPDGYSFLCPDGTKRPVNGSSPCIWVSKPWPVISAKRTSAQEIQRFIQRLDHNDTKSWQNALLNLIESYHADIHTINPIQGIEGYLLNVPGFLSANSFTGCHPPRSVRICTISNLENAKCGWMREAAAVYGLEPDFDCIKADNKTHCMEAVHLGLADVVFVSPDLLMKAERDYNLKTLLYEDVRPDERYETVAIVKKDSKIKKFSDMKGKKVCFPSYEGIAWNSMLYDFHKRGLLSYDCPYSLKAAKFFGEMCAPGAPKGTPDSLQALCKSDYSDDLGALKCFTLENADVVFISKNTLKKLMSGPVSSEKWVSKLLSEGTRIICEDEYKPCVLSWATVGQAMIRAETRNMAVQETFDVFMQTDNLFGNYYKSLTRSFSLYGPFDGVHDVLFHDSTDRLRGSVYMSSVERDIPNYDTVLADVSTCIVSSGHIVLPSIIVTILCILGAFY